MKLPRPFRALVCRLRRRRHVRVAAVHPGSDAVSVFCPRCHWRRDVRLINRPPDRFGDMVQAGVASGDLVLLDGALFRELYLFPIVYEPQFEGW